jgi:hypothetical protein
VIDCLGTRSDRIGDRIPGIEHAEVCEQTIDDVAANALSLGCDHPHPSDLRFQRRDAMPSRLGAQLAK